MAIGPVELLVLKYRGDRFTGIPAASVRKLVDAGFIRIIDALFARKTGPDDVKVMELFDLDAREKGELQPLVTDVMRLITHDDVATLTSRMEPGTTAAVLLFENLWAGRFAADVADAGGEIVLAERIPRAVIDQLVAAPKEELVAAGSR
jgi:Family of unknown function (DUF6325)